MSIARRKGEERDSVQRRVPPRCPGLGGHQSPIPNIRLQGDSRVRFLSILHFQHVWREHAVDISEDFGGSCLIPRCWRLRVPDIGVQSPCTYTPGTLGSLLQSSQGVVWLAWDAKTDADLRPSQ